MAIEKISQGVTFRGFASTMGLVIFVISIFIAVFGAFIDFSLVALTLGLVLMAIGMMLFLSIRGVLIDAEQKQVKPYVNYFVLVGTWQPLTQYDRIILRYVNEKQTMNSRAGSVTHTTKCFEIFLASDHTSELQIQEFTDYDEAKKFLAEYAKKLEKADVNTYERMKEQLQKRRREVRR
jgi:hypothetical protein